MTISRRLSCLSAIGGFLALWPLLIACARGQTLLPPGSGNHLVTGDLALLDTQESRREVSCGVVPEHPVLGFDLRFHTGFSVAIPMKEFAGAENLLAVLFRVTPLASDAEPAFFAQSIRVPVLPDSAASDALLRGEFDVGPGRYHVDWIMEDRQQRVCTFHWDIESVVSAKDRDMKLAISANGVDTAHREEFEEEPTVVRSSQAPLKIKVLVNFAPQSSGAVTLGPEDTGGLVSILRGLAREPQFGDFSVVAFNLQEQRVIYRQVNSQDIDFPALGEALRGAKLGTIDAARLQRKHGDTEFLKDLIESEVSAPGHPDALIFASPKVMLEASVSEDELKPFANVDYPVFYVNYAPDQQAIPWRDSISRALHVFRGAGFTVTRPRDLWFSLTDMLSRIVNSRTRRETATSLPAN